MLPSLKLTFLFIVLFMVVYPVSIWIIAQVGPNHGRGETISVNNKVIGYKNEGQRFTDDKYFNGRPSATDYNAATSAGSNKGPSNPEYLQQVQDRLDSFLIHNPSIKKESVPAELITASGSGLDPDLSFLGASVQVARIARARNLSEKKLNDLIASQLEKPLFGFLGTEKINVLKLNIALDAL